jgi:hypothetical protein
MRTFDVSLLFRSGCCDLHNILTTWQDGIIQSGLGQTQVQAGNSPNEEKMETYKRRSLDVKLAERVLTEEELAWGRACCR